MGARHPITWSGLAVGSAVGIAAWATFYVAGAGLFGPIGGQAAALGLGLYGGVTACFALLLAAMAAAISCQLTLPALGTLAGLTLASLANLTLLATTLVLEQQASWAHLPGLAGQVLAIGAAAVGLGATGGATHLAMLGVMLLAFALGALGGALGVRLVRRQANLAPRKLF